MSTETISPDLRTILRRLKLGRMLDTLPERLAVARSQKMAPQHFLLLVLGDEASRRDSPAATLRAQRAHLDPTMQLEAWDDTANAVDLLIVDDFALDALDAVESRDTYDVL